MNLRRALPALFVLWASAAPAWAQQATAPPDFDSLLARAAELHQAGDLMGAIDAYKAALAGQPGRADVRSNLGAAYARLGRFAEAVEQYRLALRVNRPTRRSASISLSAYYKAARLAEAVPELEASLPPSPTTKAAVLLLGDALLQQGEDQRVIDALIPHAAKFPEDLAFGYVLGSALLQSGSRGRSANLPRSHLQGRRIGGKPPAGGQGPPAVAQVSRGHRGIAQGRRAEPAVAHARDPVTRKRWSARATTKRLFSSSSAPCK